MSIATELENYKTFLGNAYTKCEEKKALIPEMKNLQNLTDCIDSIGGDYYDLGVSVTVETNNSFKTGDRFVGVPIGSVTPSIATTNLGIESIADASEDLSVAVPVQTITSSSQTIKIGFLNDENVYELVDVDLPSSIGNINNSVTLNGGSSLSVNEDGSLIMVNGFVFGDDDEMRVLVIKTRKGGGSASFYGLELDSRDGYDNFAGYSIGTPAGFVLTKNYLLIHGGYKWTYTKDVDGVSTPYSGQGVIATIHYFDGNSFGKSVYASYTGSKNLTWDKTRVAWYNNSTLIAIGSTQSEGVIQKYVLDNRTLESSASVTIAKNYTYGTYSISRNASYIGWDGHVYALNFDLSYTRVSQVGTSTQPVYPDSTGSYTLAGSGIRQTSSLDKVVFSAHSLSSRYFDVLNGYFYRSGTNKVYRIPQGNEEAEYLISSSDGDVKLSNRIYGIVPAGMVKGEIGVAQMLYNTNNFEITLQDKTITATTEEQMVIADEGYDGLGSITVKGYQVSLQDKTVTPSTEEQVVTADTGYDGLNSVTVAGDSDLVAENIKKDVDIFGVVGTLEPAPEEDTVQYLNYIESTGTQYIDTGLKGSETYSRIEIDFTPLTATATAVYFGAMYQDSSITRNTLSLWRYYSSSKYCFVAGRSNSQLTLPMSYNTDYYLIATASNGTATVVLNGTEYKLTYTYTIPDNRNIFLFANNNNGAVSNFAKMRLRSAKLYDGNQVLAHDFKPALDGNGVVCLYDKVEKKFYYNAGTGDFVSGGVVS